MEQRPKTTPAQRRHVDRRVQRAFEAHGHGGRVVLWGARRGDVQAGGMWDRAREATRRLLDREAAGLPLTNETHEADPTTAQLGPMGPPRSWPPLVTDRRTRDELLRAFHGDAS